MSDGDCSAVRIDVRRVVWNSQVAKYGERLRRESFVQFDDVHVRKLQIRLRENFARRRRGAHSHDARRNAGSSRSDDACSGLEAVLARCCLGSDE